MLVLVSRIRHCAAPTLSWLVGSRCKMPSASARYAAAYVSRVTTRPHMYHQGTYRCTLRLGDRYGAACIACFARLQRQWYIGCDTR